MNTSGKNKKIGVVFGEYLNKGIINAGFTLIELLVVISVISLLSSIVMVAVSSAREKAQIVAYRSYLQQAVNAVELYKTSTGSYPNPSPPSWMSTLMGPGGLLYNYIKYQAPGTLLKTLNQYDNYTTYIDYYGRTCGKKSLYSSTTEPYFFIISSYRSDLPMPRAYIGEAQISVENLNGEYDYCFSMVHNAYKVEPIVVSEIL